MPEKEQKKRDEGLLHQLKELLVTKFSTVVIENISERIHDMMRKLQELVYLTQEKIIEQFYVYLLLFVGYVFVMTSVLFYLIDTLHWSRSRATLTAGVLLLLTSAVMRQYVLKTRMI